jgi:Flp pilus assembly protein protease CpaA
MLMWLLLASIGLLWLVFGSIQDWRTREISDWITLSLLVIGIGTRAIFAYEMKTFSILSLGLLSTIVLLGIAFIFYYTKVFAGGDFKLLVGLGPFIPGSDFASVLSNTFFAVIALLIIGFVYSFAMSSLIAYRNKTLFKKSFKTKRGLYFAIVPAVIVAAALSISSGDGVIISLMSIISLALLAYPYLLSVDACMVKLYNPNKLTPGDWIMNDVRVGNKTIKATVHGLSENEILLLKKYGKKVLVKEGIPFVPVFLICFIIMVFAWASQGPDFLLALIEQLV